MGDDVTSQYPRHISRKEQAWLDSVLTPEPEPVQHRCGRCNNGTGVYNPDCPGRKRD